MYTTYFTFRDNNRHVFGFCTYYIHFREHTRVQHTRCGCCCCCRRRCAKRERYGDYTVLIVTSPNADADVGRVTVGRSRVIMYSWRRNAWISRPDGVRVRGLGRSSRAPFSDGGGVPKFIFKILHFYAGNIF